MFESVIEEYSNEKTAEVFKCHQCGACCRGWTVTTTPGHVKTLKQQDWVNERLSLLNTDFTPLSPELIALPKTQDASCAFLADDGQCLVEKHLGWDAKPRDCKRFPFATMPASNGLVSDISFACSAASHGLMAGRSFFPGESTDDLPGLERIPDTLPINNWIWPFSFFKTRKISFVDWQQQMQTAEAFAKQMQLSSEEAIHWLFFIWSRKQKQAISCLSKEFQQQLKSKSPQKSFRLQRLSLCRLLHKHYRTMDFVAILLGATFWERTAFKAPIHVMEALAVSIPESADVFIRAFVLQLAQRSVLFSQGYSVMDVLRLSLASVRVTRWHAQVLAWQQGRQIAELEDIRQAIQLTERHYTAHHTGFIARFHYSWLDRVWAGFTVFTL